MAQPGEHGRRTPFELRVIAASAARTLRYRAAYDELNLIHQELVAEVSRLAAAIEERLIPRRRE